MSRRDRRLSMSAPLCLPGDVVAMGFSADRRQIWAEAMFAIVGEMKFYDRDRVAQLPAPMRSYMTIIVGLPDELIEKIIWAGLRREWRPIKTSEPMKRWVSNELIAESAV